MIKRLLTLSALLLLASVSSLRADDLRLASLFSDHMVLQRDRVVPVWGRANAGEQVVVEFAGQLKTAKADGEGKWQVRLDPIAASALGRELVVRSDNEHRRATITDVVVGDVWLCSGQSNMAFRMKETANAKAEIAAANDPAIRFFRVLPQFAPTPADRVEGEWKPVSPATAEECSAVAYYFAQAIRRHHDVPIGLLVSSIGGTRIETWMHRETLVSLGVSDKLLDKWKDVSALEFAQIDAAYRAFQYERDKVYAPALKAAKAEGKPLPPEPTRPAVRLHDCPSALHNGMIAPLQPYAIRGVLWYQGEANVGQPTVYETLQPALTADWRSAWGDDLPFLFVQLAPYQSHHPSFREAQARIARQTPNAAMVVTTDVGSAKEIHPPRKKPVGERLALAARALSCGESVEYSGPVFKAIAVEDGRIVVSFTHAEGGLMAEGDTVKGFSIAGVDGKFVDADAIIEGSTVIVSAKEVTSPTAVRFGWATVPEVNLVNRDRLPAVPFRTDAPSAD
jgi:sialate O-acetylesterase